MALTIRRGAGGGTGEEVDWRPLVALRKEAASMLGGLEPGALEMAWELLSDDASSAPRTTSELCEVLFGEPGSGAALLAAHEVLADSPEGKLLFKLEQGGWVVRSADSVRQLRLAAAREAAAAAEKRLFADAWAEAQRAPADAKPPSASWDGVGEGITGKDEVVRRRRAQWRRWVRSLEAAALERDAELNESNLCHLTRAGGSVAREEIERSFASVGEGAAVLTWLNTARTPLPPSAPKPPTTASPAGLQLSSTALASLVAAGRWSVHENAAALRARIPMRFDAALLRAAEELAAHPPPDPDAAGRVDLSRLRAFTIDGAETKELDDALSVEKMPGGLTRVWIHVADPTRWMPLGEGGEVLSVPGGLLDAEALRRGTSCYFPTGSISMFPPLLAEGDFSLRAGGQPVPAFSVCADVEEDGSVAAFFATPSLVSISYKLTYEGADQLLWAAAEEEPELALLSRVAVARARWREAQGCVTISMPEISLVVSGGGVDVRGASGEAEVSLLCEQPRDAGSGSRALVSEMMVLAGEVCARMAAEAALPFPFRTQPPPLFPPSEMELDCLPPGPCRSVLWRSRMLPSQLAFAPAPHSALGLAQYSQVTSPIRRYGDLLAHQQLKAHLRGAPPPYSQPQLAARAEAAAAMNAMATKAQRESERYWTGVYFAKVLSSGGGTYQATVLRYMRDDMSLASVLIGELGVEVPVRCLREVRLGEAVTVTCVAARPREGQLFFNLV